MTTTITVETHDWPVEAKLMEEVNSETERFFSKRSILVAPHTKQSFHLSQTTRLNLVELPLPPQQAA